MRRALPFFSLMSPEREPGLESPSAIGRGTQWSVGPGGGLVRGGWRALAAQGLGDLGLPDPDKDRQLVRWADGLPALGPAGPSCERDTGVMREMVFPAHGH